MEKIKYAFVDGDIMCYQASSAVQKDIDWGDGLWTCHSEVSDAFDYLTDKLIEIDGFLKENIENREDEFIYIFCFSSETNFRKVINPEYKSNRANNRKPCCYKGLVEKVKSVYHNLEIDGIEADDVIGIYTTSPLYKGNCVAVSMDKDFKTIPCLFYNYNTNELINTTPEEAVYWTCYQTLIGDTTDGYKGCPTVGPVKAKKILNGKTGEEELREAVRLAYEKQGLTTEDYLLQYKMANILKYKDYQEVSL